MGKIITEKDFWMCSSGAMPAPLQGTRKSNKKEGGGEAYITVADTATLSTIDFGCTKSMLMTAILTAIVVVVAAVVISAFVVATGGAGLGLLALVAIGAGGGLVGGIIGMVEGNMKCGQKNAQVRHWSDSKGELLLTNTPAITSDCVMTCDVGGVVMYAPNIKTWNDAYMQASLSYFTTFLECALGGAGIGLLGGLGASAFTGMSGVATLSQSVAFTWPTWSSIGINLGIMGAVKGTSGYNQYQRGEAWGLSEEEKWDMAVPEKEAIKRIQENGYQSITLNDVLLFGSDLIGPFINIKTAPSLAAAEARAAAQGKTNPEITQNAEPTSTKGQNQGDDVIGKIDESIPRSDPPEPNIDKPAVVKGNAFESSITDRIAEMKANMTEAELSRTTFSVAKVKLANGETEVWVAGAGKKGYVPPRIRQAAGTEKVITNKVEQGNAQNRLNDAEQTIMREAIAQGAKIEEIGATRPMCAMCQIAFKEHLHTVKTPLK